MQNKARRSLFPVKYFILMWVLVGLLLFVLPIHSLVCDSLNAFLLCMLFVVIVVACSILWYQNTALLVIRHRSKKVKTKGITKKKMRFILLTSGITTLVGNVLVLYDRVFIRGIDYSLGFRNARYQWVLSTGGGPLSIIGNLMIPFSYCCLFFGVFHWESLKKKERVFSLLMGFGGQISLAIINGGRSNILNAIVFAFCVCILRKYQGKVLLPPVKGKFLLLIPAVILLFRYITSLFYAFSDNSIGRLNQYLSILGAETDAWYKGIPFFNSIIEIIAYLFHGIFYSGAVVEFNPGIVNITDINHNYTFRSVISLFGRFFDYDMILAPFDRGSSFIALPGEFLYDYGYIGFTILSALLGIALGETMKHLNTKVRNLTNIEVTVCIAVLMHIFMSPITAASSIGYFWFMVFAMIVMEFVSSKFYGSSGWTLIE